MPGTFLFTRAEELVEVTVTSLHRHGNSLLIVLGDSRSIAFGLDEHPMPLDLHVAVVDHVEATVASWVGSAAVVELADLGVVCGLRGPDGVILPLPSPR